MWLRWSCTNFYVSDARQFQNESRNFDVCRHIALSIIANSTKHRQHKFTLLKY
jgi:hypothetical protein